MNNFDFYISSNGRLISKKYDINYLVNMRESTLPFMPEVSDSSTRIAGRDGEVILSSTYQPISINIICYTDDNLTLEEKVEEENKVKKLLNSIKNKSVKLAIEKNSVFYNVKYSGALSVINYPKHLEFSIPLKSAESNGYSLKSKTIIGEKPENSETLEDVGAIISIKGEAQSPIISLNNYAIEYSNNILAGQELIIDTKKSTVTLITEEGVKSNAMKYYNHQFPKIKNGENKVKILSGISNPNQVSVIWNDLLF